MVRSFVSPRLLAGALLWLILAAPAAAQEVGKSSVSPIPVVYDTDIGGDIDDVWALSFLVHSPELELKLVTINKGGVQRKAQVAAKLLTAMGRDDVPIAIGRSHERSTPRYYDWAKDFDLSSYAGTVHEGAVARMIEKIEVDNSGRLQILAVGSMLNVAGLVQRRPELAERVRLTAMSGSVYGGYGETDEPDAEANVVVDPDAARRAYGAKWKRFTIAPLDVTGGLHLAGDRYRSIYESDAPTPQAIISAYKVFEPNADFADVDVTRRSSTLHDAAAVYLAFSEAYLGLETLSLRVTDDGYTRVDPENGHTVEAALDWTNESAFKDLLVKRLTSPPPSH
jgi:inosine-uridine nucleoside N-ribohydrolase